MAQLTLVPTPIGNLQDITLRALDTLKAVDLILAEDTRTSGVLLRHYEISKPLRSLHKFNEYKTAASLAQEIMREDWHAALISDAGTPGINDPGEWLVKECIEQGVTVDCLPGATAFVPALVASGLSCERFCYEGFLPVKKGRKTRIEALANEERTIVLYESPHRIVRTLQEVGDVFGTDRGAVIARELSKKFEEYHRGTLASLLEHFSTTEPKGEFVLIIEGKAKEKKQKKV